jgi:AcrR family transcriptional regulator
MPRMGLDRHRLVVAGADLADEVGLSAVTVSGLATRFGVRPASLYAHVRSLQDLVTGITALALDELADRAGAALAGRSGRQALAGFAGTYRDYAREHPGRYAATRSGHVSDDVLRAGRRHTELSAAVLRGYEIPEGELVHAVRFLGGSVHGFVSLELAGNFAHSDPGPQESWDRLVDVLHATLSRWPERES